MFKKLTPIKSVVLALVSVSFFAFTFAYVSPGKPSGFVNDFASVLDANTKASLENTLTEFEKSTSHEIVVVTVPTLGNDYIENYAVKLFEEWGIGKKDADNGVLFLIAVEDRKVRIEVGYGLEGALVDSEANTIIQEYVLPEFKEGDYAKGIEAGVAGIISATEGEVVSTGSPSSSSADWSEIIFFIIFALFWAVNILIQILASSKSWWMGGVLGGGAGALITVFGLFGVTLTLGIIISLIFATVGLLFDYIVSKNSDSILKKFGRGKDGGMWGGGSWGGGSSSSGGFGGFGGGGSGGGGASGRW